MAITRNKIYTHIALPSCVENKEKEKEKEKEKRADDDSSSTRRRRYLLRAHIHGTRSSTDVSLIHFLSLNLATCGFAAFSWRTAQHNSVNFY